MRVAFIDTINWDYTPLTPLERPLGGIQSALCYLASALAARNHQVILINRCQKPGVYGGVECRGGNGLNIAELNQFDAIISVAAIGNHLRASGITRPLILWAGHDIDQPFVQPLKDPRERNAWTRIALLSNWQAARFQSAFDIDEQQITLARYAASPAFEPVRARATPYFFESGQPPVFAYTSTPYRGLEPLLTAFPTIARAFPGARLRIYSGMGIYQVSATDDEYRLLYALADAIRNIEYVGPLGQAALSRALHDVDILLYPNTFAETACIAVIEAMAAGCQILTTANGALPETSAGFAHLFQPQATMSQLGFCTDFADWTIATVGKMNAEPVAARQQLERQSNWCSTTYTWANRAREWEEWLSAL